MTFIVCSFVSDMQVVTNIVNILNCADKIFY